MALETQDDNEHMLSEINMIPFIDVMLVLLIVFIVTVPVLNHAVSLELPRASVQALQQQPSAIRLSIDENGAYFWNDESVSDADFATRLGAAAAQQPPPELQIRADRAVRYERVAQALAAAQRAGLRQIGFVTEPIPLMTERAAAH
ncbi:biopolymer transporter ExbD [Hydrogenophaga sp.]|uniref:ExbD/TolR family protein n=1 Tax=Hydrogenophaga sp. TaxID=1904254 RepID=UPI0019BE14C7|nr:biopolymer transporter ExbD [Hydrogenophaga sp.]MBD3892768.1 biopolymer transporter ExbD [Hydrogenophaga sp.]